jgi:AhpD family alkylhydroperoxidase
MTTSTHGPRMSLAEELPSAYAALVRLDRAAGEHLDERLLELVKLRVSQLNGCGFCLDLHAPKARHAGESQQRLDVLAAWREVPFFDERERAARMLPGTAPAA